MKDEKSSSDLIHPSSFIPQPAGMALVIEVSCE
jgi:hypothetical protein